MLSSEVYNRLKALAEADSIVANHYRCRRRRRCHRHFQSQPNCMVDKCHSRHMVDNKMMKLESPQSHGVYFSLYSPEAMHSIVSKTGLNESHLRCLLFKKIRWKKFGIKTVLNAFNLEISPHHSPDRNPVMPKNLPFRIISSVALTKIAPTK